MLGLVLLVLFVLLAFVVPQAPLELEQRWNEWMTDIATAALKNIALVFNYLGRGFGRALLIAVPAAVLFVARRRWSLAAFALTEALTPLISSIMADAAGWSKARWRAGWAMVCPRFIRCPGSAARRGRDDGRGRRARARACRDVVRTCFSTAPPPTTSAPVMAEFDRPSAISASTSRSRGVSSPSG